MKLRRLISPSPGRSGMSGAVVKFVSIVMIGMLAVMTGDRCLFAQDALVLSGGGARGLAHIGVVERLDELGYDPQLVVGTSMGAVVGALYAAGYSAAEIKSRVLAVRWSELFDATPLIVGPDRALHVPAFSIDLEVGALRNGRGLFGQWRVNRSLVQLLFDANARSRGDFDNLARPYRAVAADLQTGEAVVLDRGDLARAVRASMAYPGFFAPVPWHGRVLVDGGIVDNFPVAIARKLGAGYVIGVDVTALPEEIGSQSPLSAIDRALRLMQENLGRHDIPPDVLIQPTTGKDFLGPSFPDDPRELMQLGYDVAKRTLGSAVHAAAAGGRAMRPAPQRLGGLLIEAPDTALAHLGRKAYSSAISGKFDADAILAATDRLYTTGLFEAIWPRVESAADTTEPPNLVVRLEAPPRVALTGNAHFENDRGGRAWVSLDRFGRLMHAPTVFSLSGSAGALERWAAVSARVHFATRSPLALSIGAHALERDVRTFTADAMRTSDVLRLGGWAGVEAPHILRERLLTLGARAEHIEVESGATGMAVGPVLRYSAVAAQARPVGVPLLLEVERRWGSFVYTSFIFRSSYAIRTRATQLAVIADARAVSRGAPIDVFPALGDQHALPGWRWGEGRGRARLVTGVDVALPVSTGFVRLRGRTGAISSDLDHWDSARWITGGQIGFFLRTPIGVIDAGYGIAKKSDGRFDISIGRNF